MICDIVRLGGGDRVVVMGVVWLWEGLDLGEELRHQGLLGEFQRLLLVACLC